jgi:hypothetical protein
MKEIIRARLVSGKAKLRLMTITGTAAQCELAVKLVAKEAADKRVGGVEMRRGELLFVLGEHAQLAKPKPPAKPVQKLKLVQYTAPSEKRAQSSPRNTPAAPALTLAEPTYTCGQEVRAKFTAESKRWKPAVVVFANTSSVTVCFKGVSGLPSSSN